MVVNALVAPTTSSVTELAETAVVLERAGVSGLLLGRGPVPSAFEPTTLAATLAGRTERLGLVVADTAHAGYPYNVARRLASLDHISRGRAGWLVDPAAVPADSRAYEQGPGEQDQAAYAAEYLTVVRQLWTSWERGAERPDKASGRYQDDDRVHPVSYRSANFQVAGALNVPRSPQGLLPVFTVVRDETQVGFAAAQADVVVLRAEDPAVHPGLHASLLRELEHVARRRPLLVSEAVCVDGARSQQTDAWVEALAVATRTGTGSVTVVGDGSPAWARAVVGALGTAGLVPEERPGAAGPATLASMLGLRPDTTEDREAA